MSPMSHVSKTAMARTKVDRLLTEASSEKLIRHETKTALQKLEEADKLIEEYDLNEPWPSICAYRMGHLILRTASTKNELREARALFAAARGAGCLGPLPHIYNLAVLYRLKQFDESSIAMPFQKAIASIESIEMEENPQIQDHVFNLIELASYFSKLDYGDLQGMGLPHINLSKGSPWILVGPNPEWSNVVYSKKEALEELNGLMKTDRSSEVVFFMLSDKNSQTSGGLKRHWKSGEQDWQKATYQRLRLLALSLWQPACPLDNIRIAIVGERGTFNAVSKLKSLLKKDISGLTGIDENEIYDDSIPGFIRLSSKLKVFGAVECSAISFNDFE